MGDFVKVAGAGDLSEGEMMLVEVGDERLLLANEAGGARCRAACLQHFEFDRLSPRLQSRFELVGEVEMILDGALSPAGDKHEMLYPGLDRFIDGILNDRLVHDGQHFLRDDLGGRKEAGAEAGYRENGFSDFPDRRGIHEIDMLLARHVDNARRWVRFRISRPLRQDEAPGDLGPFRLCCCSPGGGREAFVSRDQAYLMNISFSG